MSEKLISLVVPCYNEETGIELFYRTVIEKLHTLSGQAELEFWFVDDGSHDQTLPKIRNLHKQDSRVHYCSFSRNFGKEAAMLAGLERSRGDYVVIIDADLQDPPEYMLEMYSLLEEGGFDCVATRRATRTGESPVRSAFARMFYWLMSRLTQVNLVDGARDYRMMNRKYVQSILSLGEYNRFSKGIFGWVGYRVKLLSFENVERNLGVSKWSFWGLCKYALDGIVAFSTSPLYLSFIIGICACLFAFMMCIKTLIKTLFFHEAVAGYTTLLVCITLFGGLQFLLIGVLGLYVSKIYQEVKKRPIYVVQASE